MILNYKNSKIHYNTEGKGSAIVLLHGFLENVDMWNDLTPILSQKHQVVRIDLLGHGKTQCLGYIHTMDMMAEAVIAVLEHLNLKKAYFIGHSMGGYVALAIAEKHPHFLKGLCLMNSTYEADDKARKLIRTRACKMAQNNYHTLVKMSFANLFTAESKIKFKSDYEKALDLALKTPLQGYIAAQEGMKLRSNLFDVFANLKCNKLMIIGKKDSLANALSIRNQIKNTDINIVEFSEGHMSHIENKSDLSYYLLRFIENQTL